MGKNNSMATSKKPVLLPKATPPPTPGQILGYKVPKGRGKERADLSKDDVKRVVDAINELGLVLRTLEAVIKPLAEAKEVIDWARLKMTSERLEAMSKQFGGGQ